jgi:hypothetical protein
VATTSWVPAAQLVPTCMHQPCCKLVRQLKPLARAPPPPPLLSQYGSREAYEEAMEAAKDRSRKSEKQTVSNH